MSMEPLPPLVLDPVYGHFPWWPVDGDAWIHPDDVPLARRTIPGPRVWCRDGKSGDFHTLYYGTDRLRIHPVLWCEAPRPSVEIGELVEVLPRGLVNEPHTGVVCDIWWDENLRELQYRLRVAGKTLETFYSVADLKRVSPPSPRMQARIEPTSESGIDLEPI